MVQSRLYVCNNTLEDVECVWVKNGDTEVPYEMISSGERFRVTTYDGHMWRFIYQESGEVIREYTAGNCLHIMDVIEFKDAPGGLCCDVTWTFMHDPVRASDGHVYDLYTMYKLFERDPDPTSPFSREPLTSVLMVERDVIEECKRYSGTFACTCVSRQSIYNEIFESCFQFM